MKHNIPPPDLSNPVTTQTQNTNNNNKNNKTKGKQSETQNMFYKYYCFEKSVGTVIPWFKSRFVNMKNIDVFKKRLCEEFKGQKSIDITLSKHQNLLNKAQRPSFIKHQKTVSEPAEPSYSVNTLLGIFKGMKSADKYMRTLYEDGYINNREAQAQIYYKADVVRLKAHPIDMIDNFLQVEQKTSQ